MMRCFKIALLSTAFVGGCTAAGTPVRNDATDVLHALVTTLTADKKSVCLDNKTYGEPLSIYRTMMALPATSRPALNWAIPSPLRPPIAPTGRRVLDSEMRSAQILLRRPAQMSTVLPSNLQRELDAAAGHLGQATDNLQQTIEPWSGAPLAQPQWWGFNRLSVSCSPVYTVSHPVVAKDLAFVSVTAGHWGTIYAFNKRAGQWTTLAQWSNWLY